MPSSASFLFLAEYLAFLNSIAETTMRDYFHLKFILKESNNISEAQLILK